MADRAASSDYDTPAGRRRAWRELMLGDHGALRKFYDNTHEVVAGKMWRTYQPSPAHLRRWKERGVKTVINLRGDKPSGFLHLEREACAALGLDLRTFHVFSREAPSRETLYGARDLFQSIAYPAVMHCKSGADRAGLMAALFLFLHEGRPLDEALEQLSFRYGHIRRAKTGVLDYAFVRYIEFAKANNYALDDQGAFFNWIDARYDPAAMKAAFKPAPWGVLLADVILRRE